MKRIVVCILSVFIFFGVMYSKIVADESYSWIKPGWIQPGVQNVSIYAFSGNPITFTSDEQFDINIGDESNIKVQRLNVNEFEVATEFNRQVNVKISSNSKILFRYKDPYVAFRDYANMYKEFSVPWQRRIYIENYISPINGNQTKFPPEMFNISDEVNFGAPYSWGGKQTLQIIFSKLTKNTKINEVKPSNFQDVYTQKKSMFPPNLDEGESRWDYKPGFENPWYWAGVDCSGILEKCCEYAGLIWDWRNVNLIASGDYRGTEGFKDVKAGDILILKRDGSVVHFGIISQKGLSLPTTYMIHSAWFTNYRYNTNTVQKVIETSITEFRSVYKWDIGRLRVNSF